MTADAFDVQHRNMHARALAHCEAAGHESVVVDGATIYVTGGAAGYNVALVDGDGDVEVARQWFVTAGLPGILRVLAGTGAADAARRRADPPSEWPVMVTSLPLVDDDRPWPVGLRVEVPVDDPALAAGALQAVQVASGMAPDAAALIFPAALAARDEVLVGSATDDVGLAAAGLLVSSPGAVGLYGLAAMPRCRGTGVGAAMVRSMFSTVAAAGDDLGVLQTSRPRVPFFQRLGFRVVGAYLDWQVGWRT